MTRKLGPVEEKIFKNDLLKARYFEIKVDGKPVRYVESNNLSRERVETLFDKEPTTIPWLEAIEPGEILIDIGANVGMYTIYAAAVAGARVYAFEPESQNYSELNKSIYLNQLHEKVTAYCLAISDEAKVSHLLLSRFGPAFAHHDFGTSSWGADKQIGKVSVKENERLAQGSVAFSLDELIQSGAIPMPDHIKIDVDGFENKVIKGAQKTLQNPKLKSVLLEVEYKIPSSLALISELQSQGWKYSIDQVRMNRHEILTPEQFEARVSGRKGGQNFIFFKDEKYSRLFTDFIRDFVPPHPHKPAAPKAAPTPVVPPSIFMRLKRRVWNLENPQ